jgi:hypothetical protein
MKMFETWLRMVFSDRTSSAAMAWLLRPRATSRRTSSSRGVSSGNAAVGVGALARRAAKYDVIRPASAGPEDDAAVGHRVDRPHDLRLVGALHQVAASTRLDRGEHRLVVVHGQHQHRCRRMGGGDQAGCLHAVHLGHVEVHHHDVG